MAGRKEGHTGVDSGSGWSLGRDRFLEISRISPGETRSHLAIWPPGEWEGGAAGGRYLQGRGRKTQPVVIWGTAAGEEGGEERGPGRG